jgi:hypothetical protein
MDPRARFLLGKIEEKGGNTDLTTIRRPSVFAQSPYREPIAAADAQTYVWLSSRYPQSLMSGVGYLPAETTAKDDGRGPGRDRGLFIGGIELQNNIVFFPSSAILAGIHKWPSAFFARGLWCYADALEGTLDSYSRVKGLKDLVVVRGPHPYETWPESEKKRVQDRMIAYARAVILGHTSQPELATWSNMKELVATSADAWEPSTHPTNSSSH